MDTILVFILFIFYMLVVKMNVALSTSQQLLSEVQVHKTYKNQLLVDTATRDIAEIENIK